jgi:Hypothetical glycosyl hydrolase family 15
MPASPKSQKKTYLGMTLPQLSIAAVLVILICFSIIALAGLAFSPATPLPTLIPTLPEATSLPPTSTPAITPTPIPSDTPTATPTDIPSATFTATATATATAIPAPTMSPTKGVAKPPDTTDNIHVAQIFTSVATPEEEIGKVDLVWGSVFPDQPAGVYNLYYYPFDRDADTGTGGTHHDLNWFMANHGDWIEYTCDKKTPAYEYGDPEVPLDITNPAVLDYMLQTYLIPAIQKGYQGIAFDNVDLGNNGARCGIWQNGHWITQTDYIGGVLNWAAYMYKALHALNASVAMNFPFDFNHSKESYQIYQSLDIALDERGFTNRGQSIAGYLGLSEWLSDIEAFQYLAANGKAFVIIDEMPEPFAQVSQAEKQWALANYLLVKGQYSYIAITGIQEYGKTLLTPEYSADIGHALGPMYQSQGVYMRDFSNGIAIVNPSSFNQTFNIILPSGVYQDLYGNKINLLTLQPQTGIVLLEKTTHTAYLFSGPNNAFFSFSPNQIFGFP